MLGLHMGVLPASPFATLPDTETWLQRINRASVVANVQAGLLPRELACRIREALDAMQQQAQDDPSYVRSDLYIQFEPKLLALCGKQASVLHVGRSSQDILATANAGMNRERILLFVDVLLSLLEALLRLAKREKNTIVPAYTNGVQAQPTLYSHYLLAHFQVFGRDLERLKACYERFSQCPMGSGVCNGSGWPLPTERMAQLLGFKTSAENAFDAGQCQGNDFPLEITQVLTAVMLHVNQFLADFMVQYAQARPWILYASQNGVYISSAMPQKRNPGLINDCRRDAGLVISAAQSAVLRMQNLPLGMPDVRDTQTLLTLFSDAATVVQTLTGILEAIKVDAARALEELNHEWTCTQELADTLTREGNLDFRRAHHFASTFVTWARHQGKTPENVTYEDLAAHWQQWVTTQEGLPSMFPLSTEMVRQALDPRRILEARQTRGSASLALIDDQLHMAGNRYEHWQSWQEAQEVAQQMTWTTLEESLHDL